MEKDELAKPILGFWKENVFRDKTNTLTTNNYGKPCSLKMEKQLKNISKYLSFILRHKPDDIGLTLDHNGWGSVDDLIEKTSTFELTPELISIVVETNDKQRFSLSSDSSKIRANQGHSININLELTPQKPPTTLLHGTAHRFWSAIKDEGLVKGSRHHVHLSESRTVALAVGNRYGKPVLLEIAAAQMHTDGFEFFKTINNVWLVDSVPPKYLKET